MCPLPIVETEVTIAMTDEPPKLSGRHADTLQHLFAHPLSHNVEWREVLALLRDVAVLDERDDGNVEVTAAGERFVLQRPHEKDLDADDLVKVRRLLESLGYHPGSERGD